jgi:hypothetical protein
MAMEGLEDDVARAANFLLMISGMKNLLGRRKGKQTDTKAKQVLRTFGVVFVAPMSPSAMQPLQPDPSGDQLEGQRSTAAQDRL